MMDTPPPIPLPVAPPATGRGQSPKTVRALGWLLIVLGIFLSGSMAAVANFLSVTISHAAQHGSVSRWHGNQAFTRTTFELFGAVFLFGLVAFVAGIYQVRTGRRSRFLIALLFVTVALIVYFGSGILSTSVPA